MEDTYKTFLRSANNFSEFSSARKKIVDTGLTRDEAYRACQEYNKNRSEDEIERGTKMEFTAESTQFMQNSTAKSASLVANFLGEKAEEAVVKVEVTGTPASVQRAIARMGKGKKLAKLAKEGREPEPEKVASVKERAEEVVEVLLAEKV